MVGMNKGTFRSIEMGDTPLIIDNTHTIYDEMKAYVEYALPQEYKIRIQEPTSDRWKEIVELLGNKRKYKKELKEWSKELAACSEEVKGKDHPPVWAIQRMMWRWESTKVIETKIQNKIKELKL